MQQQGPPSCPPNHGCSRGPLGGPLKGPPGGPPPPVSASVIFGLSLGSFFLFDAAPALPTSIQCCLAGFMVLLLDEEQ
ncbi:hypothetical protein Emed_000600 [Eimeria media]